MFYLKVYHYGTYQQMPLQITISGSDRFRLHINTLSSSLRPLSIMAANSLIYIPTVNLIISRLLIPRLFSRSQPIKLSKNLLLQHVVDGSCRVVTCLCAIGDIVTNGTLKLFYSSNAIPVLHHRPFLFGFTLCVTFVTRWSCFITVSVELYELMNLSGIEPLHKRRCLCLSCEALALARGAHHAVPIYDFFYPPQDSTRSSSADEIANVTFLTLCGCHTACPTTQCMPCVRPSLPYNNYKNIVRVGINSSMLRASLVLLKNLVSRTSCCLQYCVLPFCFCSFAFLTLCFLLIAHS